MRRADRLFRILEVLRSNDVTTAQNLADALEVSVRTVYRDVHDLITSGVRIRGEAGTGYQLTHFDLPPLMFDRDEIEALAFGMRMVKSWGDSELAASAKRVLAKIEAVLPTDRRHLVEGTPLYVPAMGSPDETIPFDIAILRRAIRHRHRTEFSYRDAEGAETVRVVWPLAMVFFGQIWFLLAWCELRGDFRTFRPDRVSDPKILDDHFPNRDDRSVEEYRRRRQREYRRQ